MSSDPFNSSQSSSFKLRLRASAQDLNSTPTRDSLGSTESYSNHAAAANPAVGLTPTQHDSAHSSASNSSVAPSDRSDRWDEARKAFLGAGWSPPPATSSARLSTTEPSQGYSPFDTVLLRRDLPQNTSSLDPTSQAHPSTPSFTFDPFSTDSTSLVESAPHRRDYPPSNTNRPLSVPATRRQHLSVSPHAGESSRSAPPANADSRGRVFSPPRTSPYSSSPQVTYSNAPSQASYFDPSGRGASIHQGHSPLSYDGSSSGASSHGAARVSPVSLASSDGRQSSQHAPLWSPPDSGLTGSAAAFPPYPSQPPAAPSTFDRRLATLYSTPANQHPYSNSTSSYGHYQQAHSSLPPQQQQQQQYPAHQRPVHPRHSTTASSASSLPTRFDFPSSHAGPSPPSPPKLRSGLPQRTTWAMWVGNVPADTTEPELWKFFIKRLPPLDPRDPPSRNATGIESIHLIARSNCAFVNFVSSAHLSHAINMANGYPLRPSDRKCKPLVCRLRMREDDAKSGVGAQRGGGLHKSYLRATEKRQRSGSSPSTDGVPLSESALAQLQDAVGGEADPRSRARTKSRTGSGRSRSRSHSSSMSTTSTSSSLFEAHFPRRYFVLKAHSLFDLEQSVRTGLWSTQGHNESVLDQAYRTSKDGVYLIFSANRSGEFFGYARMKGPIYPLRRNSDGDGGAKVSNLSAPHHHSRSEGAHDRQRATERPMASRTESGGLPFAVEWQSISPIPFHRTRHILNSFNANREVKISRDGTEIEPVAGSELTKQWSLQLAQGGAQDVDSATGPGAESTPSPLSSLSESWSPVTDRELSPR